MKVFGEIVGNFFKTIFSALETIIKSAWWVILCGVLFAMTVFILAVFFNAEVRAAVEIFQNVLKIP